MIRPEAILWTVFWSVLIVSAVLFIHALVKFLLEGK